VSIRLSTAPAHHSPPECSPVDVLTDLLVQIRDVIALLPSNVYRAGPAARVSGSVGAHVRHTLDHVGAWLAAVSGDELRYDARARGTIVEVDAACAVHAIERVLFQLDRLPSLDLDAPIGFSTLLHPDQPAAHVRSTLARELAFVIQHTVHHCGLMALLLEWQQRRVPHGFGMAASTRRAQALAG
jgi:uncharacterized damage-inducible protein DinB